MVLNAEIEQWEFSANLGSTPRLRSCLQVLSKGLLEFASHEKWKTCENFPWSILHRTKLGTHGAEKKTFLFQLEDLFTRADLHCACE